MNRVRGEGGRFNSNLPMTGDDVTPVTIAQDNGTAAGLGLVFQIKEERQQPELEPNNQLPVTTVNYFLVNSFEST